MDTATGAGIDPVLSLTDIHHRYGHVVAIKQCSLEVRPGEIHGLVGENGSGKSTMVKILSGIVQPTRGDVAVSGKATRLKSPAQAQQSGIITVFQETLIAEGNSATENVFIGTDGIFRHGQRRKEELKRAREVLEQLGVDPLILRRPVHALSLAHRQVLTLVRALVRPWKLLVLDEATSALDIGTRDRLFDLIRGLRDEGRSVLFVSHRMDELSLLVDRVTVQRSGSTVGVLDKAEATPERLVSLMSGRGEEGAEGVGEVPADEKKERPDAAVLLELRGTRLSGGDPFDLDVRAGEILGVA
ncbi:MAG: ATP-binding cassette domain-containing protein, partial [Propionibacteriaceae bacterium]